MQEYKDLSGLPASEQVLWVLTRTGKFLIRDVRRILCLPVHKDLRFNLREWLKRQLRDHIRDVTRGALRLALHAVVGRRLTWRDYVSDQQDLSLGWLSEYAFRVHPTSPFTYQQTYSDGSVEREETQQELDARAPDPSLSPPSDPEAHLFSVSPSVRTVLSSELQGKVLEHLGPQPICDVIVSCFGRGDREFDSLCITALERSVSKGVFAFVREALADDLDLFLSASARERYWDPVREDIVSSLWGFPGAPGDYFGRQGDWRSAGFLRAGNEWALGGPVGAAAAAESGSRGAGGTVHRAT